MTFRIILALVTCSSLVSSASANRLLTLHDDWSSSIRAVLGGYGERVSILDGLNRPERSVRIETAARHPYELKAGARSIRWYEEGYALSLALPFEVNRQDFALSFKTTDISASGKITGDASQFSLGDDATVNSIAAMHHWSKLKVRWGIKLQWFHLGAITRLDPVWEIQWGEESHAGFAIQGYRHSLINPWSWNRDGSVFSGTLEAVIEGIRFNIKLGEPFESTLNVSISDDEINRPRNTGSDGYMLTPQLTRTGLNAYWEKLRQNGIGYRFGGSHRSSRGEVNLKIGGADAARAESIKFAQNGIGGEVWGRFSSGLDWMARADYYFNTGYADGWIITAMMPEGFAAALRGDDLTGADRLFYAESDYAGFAVAGELRGRKSYINSSLRLGYLDLATDASVVDFPYDIESPSRLTEFNTSRVGVGWGTFTAIVRAGQMSFGATVSQAALLHHSTRLTADKAQPAELSGGRFFKVWTSYQF